MGLPRHFRIPSLTVGSLLANSTAPVFPVAAGTCVAEVLTLMAQHDVKAVAVVEDKQVFGVFSERDQLRLARSGLLMDKTITVRESMTACSLSAQPQQEVSTCLTLMRMHQLQHLPIFDQGRLIGLISLEELQAAIIDHYERVFQELELDLKILFLQGTYSC